MSRSSLLVALTVLGSALCCWPATAEPSLGLPWWLPLTIIALMTGLATALSDGKWLRFVVSSTLGTFAGLCSGFALFPSADVIARSYTPVVLVVATMLSLLASLPAGLAGRKLSVSSENLRLA